MIQTTGGASRYRLAGRRAASTASPTSANWRIQRFPGVFGFDALLEKGYGG